jgi:hypothetical protein
MRYLSQLVRRKAVDAGVFYKEFEAINSAKWRIENTIAQHEDPSALRHEDSAAIQHGNRYQLPAYKAETLAKLKTAITTLDKAAEQLHEVGRLFAYEHEYEDDFNKNFKG